MSRYLTTAEVADLVRQKPATVRFWRYQGRGPQYFKLPGGRRILYRAEDVEAWIATGGSATGTGGAAA